MNLEVRGGLGDEVAATAIVRELKRARPDEIVRVFQPNRPEVWLHNPWLNHGTVDAPAPDVTGDGKIGRFILRMDVLNRTGGSVAHRHAAQLGLQIADDTPEIWLTADERAVDFIAPARQPKTIALDVGTGWESKRWPTSRWAQLVPQLIADGWDVVAVGGDRTALSGELSSIKYTASFFNKTTIREAAVLLSQCALFMGQDSGLMHLAAAVGTPQVVVWGRTKWYDYGYYNTTSVFPYTDCGANCYRECYRPPKVKTSFSHCMDEIPVARVFDAVQLAARRFAYRPSEHRAETRTAIPRRGWTPKPPPKPCKCHIVERNRA